MKKVLELNSTTIDLKKRYSNELVTLRAIFETWSDMDLIACLEEAQGDLQLVIGRISEGQAEQWGEVKQKKKEKKEQVPAPVRGTRGGRGGRGRGGRGGYTGDRSSQPHGGEKSAKKKTNDGWDAPQANNDWDAPLADPTVASTDDWGTTAVSTTEQEWVELEKNTAKLSLKKKKDFNTVKTQPVGNAPPAATVILAPKKKSNWADIVKKSEKEPEPVKEEIKKKPVSPKVKEVLEVPKPVAPARSPSPQHIQAQPSPKTPISPPKPQFTSPRLAQEPPQKSPVQNTESLLPPGLGQARTGRKGQDAPVVMPRDAMLSSTGTGVQFGSFKVEAEKQPSPDRVEEQVQYKTQPKQAEQAGAPGLGGHYQQQAFGQGNLNAMPDYGNGMYDERGMGGYYVPDTNSYSSSKFGTDSTATAAQSPATQHADGAHHPQNFQPYPYYPYYMPNQFQQSHYQPMYGQPFGKGYGFQQQQQQAAVPSPSQAAGSHTSSQSKPANPISQVPTGYPYPPGGQFYPSNVPYEDVNDYGKYGQQNFAAFNSTISANKQPNQSRNVRPYEQSKQPQQQPPVPGYYGNQMPGMPFQPFMMQPGYPQQQMHQQGYQSQRGQQGYWNGN